MLASYFYGHLSFMMFGGSLVARFGPKPMSVGGTVLAGVASLLYPSGVLLYWFPNSCLVGSNPVAFLIHDNLTDPSPKILLS